MPFGLSSLSSTAAWSALTSTSAQGDVLHWSDLGLQPGIELGFFTLRFYALAYVLGILLGFWQLLRMARAPGSPVTESNMESLVFGSVIGIIVGGRLGYAVFYRPELLTSIELVQPWKGGMAFHGGLIGVIVAVAWVCYRQQLNVIRVLDYVAVVVPIGMMFGRLGNFVNGELWGRPSDVPWAMIFPGADDQPRHPSQLYQAGLEGLALLVLLMVLFWATRARWRAGLLSGVFALGIGLARFVVEFFREPDTQLVWLVERTGLSMGQWLTLPLMALGVGLIAFALTRPPVSDDQPVSEQPASDPDTGGPSQASDPDTASPSQSSPPEASEGP